MSPIRKLLAGLPLLLPGTFAFAQDAAAAQPETIAPKAPWTK
jgi:hypothetical protein